MRIEFKPNSLYYGDCLEIMRAFPDESVDLICLDPPFNSNENYNKIFKDSGMNIDPQIKTFDDTWKWSGAAKDRVERIKNAFASPASKVIQSFELIIPKSQMLAYTSYMAERIAEMHRILKPTGSMYLHCDPTASHYLKLIMDAVFGEKNFRNEIIWCYTGPSRTKRWFPRKHDTILFYVKSDAAPFNFDAVRVPYVKLETGKTSGIFKQEAVLSEDGKVIEDWWPDITPVGRVKGERLGYRTQKRVPLYERMIKASSNAGDLVLDPFCGCGTTIEAALKNGRRAIGIDILPFALSLVNKEKTGGSPLPVHGIPPDFDTAAAFAKSAPFEFQDWAISLIDGLGANDKKSADEGVDGFGKFHTKPTNMDQRGIVVQVTAARGSQKRKFDELQTTVRNHNAAMGILITLDKQSASGGWTINLPRIEIGETSYSPMQCFSIQEYFESKRRWRSVISLPPLTNPWTGKEMQPTLISE